MLTYSNCPCSFRNASCSTKILIITEEINEGLKSREMVNRVCIENDFFIGISINKEKSTTSVIQVYIPYISEKKEEVQKVHERIKSMFDA